jgi:NAD(P)-dependent dehydrogenase (short-subunit alcohol dehydrogenase family)
MTFSRSTAIGTGAASGIGRAPAIAFARAGANVALLDISGDGLALVANEIKGLGAQAALYETDIADVDEVRQVLHSVAARFGRLDALANVAAVFPSARISDVTTEMWDFALGVNLRGVFFACQSALRIMADQGNGAIVNVASGAAFRPIEGLAVYSAAKAGVVGVTRVLALEYARKGVRVNVVAPGHTSSLLGHDLHPTTAETEEMVESLVPGRLMDPEESAQAILWLCSAAASGVNGAIINVNGGNHMPQG